MDKNELRGMIFTKLKLLPDFSRRRQSLELIEKLKQLPVFQQSKNILLYVSQNYEVETHTLIHDCLKTKNVFLPKVNKEKDVLQLYELKKWEDLQPGPFSILEPPTTKKVSLSHIDLAIVPAIAFTKEGNRLGHGKGYYDKLFASSKKLPYTIGLALHEQIVEEIPVEKHDYKVDLVLTT
jgi:5-formyltetrahydrofolate cyclo-ligase